ncbi:MAG: septum formation initiator family protein [Candidatus Tagabacteria bacterium]
MREFQERRKLRRIIFSRFAFVLLGIILIFLTYSTAKIYLRSRQAKEVNEMVKKEVEDLKNRKSELEASVKRLQTEAGAEEEIRSKFPVQKPGENAVMIVEGETKSENLIANSSIGFFQKIWQFVKNIF